MNRWIFQGVPSRYDVADPEKVKEGKTEIWLASHFRETMEVGDIVYLWRAGEREKSKRGLYAWGRIVGEIKHYEGWGWGVSVKYIKRFPRHISPSELNKYPAFTSHLLNRMAIGTNFSVSEDENEAIKKAIRETVGETYLPEEE